MSDGLRLAYRIDDYTDPWRTPETVVLLHAAMSSSRRMYAMVPHFARRFRVVRLDLRGHGGSQVPDAGQMLSLERLTRDVLELLDHLGIASAHFVGASGGGYLAQQIAIHHPARLRGLVLLASRPGFKDSNAAGWIPQMERMGLRPFIASTIDDRLPRGEVSEAQIEWFLDEIAGNDPAFVRRFVLYMTTQYWMSDLDRIVAPTLLVAPGDESIGNAAAYQEMRRRIRDSELVVYEGARHNMCDYLADRCARDAMDFLLRRFPQAGG